jgi:cyclohexa-1,5-dienecarbonyl-CoA hydratase
MDGGERVRAESRVRISGDGGVARIAIARPPVNVLDIATLEELEGAFRAAGARAGTRAIVLSGEGRAFSAGVDVGEHRAPHTARMLRAFHDLLEVMLTDGPPIVARVHGACLGGGMEIALAADLVVAGASAKFGQPEIAVGVFPPAACLLLPAVVGERKAREIVLRGATFGAGEALAMGLVNRVVPDDGLDAAMDALAADLSAKSGAVLRIARKALDRGDFRARRARAEALYLEELMATADAGEGLAAFLEKRSPVWRDA